MTKMSRQKFKYLENEKSFYDEIKSIFYHFLRAIIEVNKKIFLEGESPTLSNMPTSFCDKVPVLNYKTECKGSSTFGGL